MMERHGRSENLSNQAEEQGRLSVGVAVLTTAALTTLDEPVTAMFNELLLVPLPSSR